MLYTEVGLNKLSSHAVCPIFTAIHMRPCYTISTIKFDASDNFR